MNQLVSNMKSIKTVVDKVACQDFRTLFDFLQERIEYPESFVTLLGETSSGKSSILNGLLGSNILRTGPNPTTGAVVEIMDDPAIKNFEYFAVTKNAKLETLTKEQFGQFSKNLPEQYERLRLLTPSYPKGLKGLRFFDTPGYGSIHENHEKIIKSFMPNSDIIIYVISYRVGVNESDAEFIGLIEELFREDMTFYLVINRTPENKATNDRRVKEIINHVQDLLHQEIPVYLVHGEVSTMDGEPPLPAAEELWESIKNEISSEKRKMALHHSLLGFQKSLLFDVQGYLEKRKVEQLVTDEERKLLEETSAEFLAKKQVVETKIESTFERVNTTTKKMFKSSADEIVACIQSEITSSNRWTHQQECAGYVQTHLMPMLAKKETKNIRAYIERELDQLNEEIDSMLNAAVQKLERKIHIENRAFEQLVLNVSNRVAQRFADQALQAFFRQYGGVGGAGAGVANAAKKGLKKAGDLVGKTFSRETHNQLARFLSRIGATSTRAIGAAAAVIVEAGFYLYEVALWQSELIKQVGKAVSLWEEKSIKAVDNDLLELKRHNLEQVESFFREYKEAFSLKEYEGNEENINRIEEQLSEIQSILQNIERERIAS